MLGQDRWHLVDFINITLQLFGIAFTPNAYKYCSPVRRSLNHRRRRNQNIINNGDMLPSASFRATVPFETIPGHPAYLFTEDAFYCLAV